ncbi:hypothetical protein D3C76_846510 [compost metagenome]
MVRERQIPLSVEGIERHLCLQVQRHPAVIAFVDQGNEAANRIVLGRQRRQFTVTRHDPRRAIFGASGNTPRPLFPAQRRNAGDQNRGKTVAQGHELHGRQGLIAQIGETTPDSLLTAPHDVNVP